jgi:hypothetical protein
MPELNAILTQDDGRAIPIKIGTLTLARDNSTNIRMLKMASGSLTAGLGNAYAFAWQNPESTAIIVREIIIDITTAATAAATLDVDVVANATSNSNTIFSAIALNGARLFTSLEVGSGGNEYPHYVDAKGGANDWVTGYESANQSMAAMVAKYYIIYQEV